MRNSSLVYRLRAISCAEDITGLKPITEAANFPSIYTRGVVEERSCQRRSPRGSKGGAAGSENVGMSNDKPDEKSGHRKPKVSHATIIDVGLVGPKTRPKGVADGQQVNIPAPV